MKLIEEAKGRCEMGQCKQRAAFCIKFDRVGIRSKIDLCGNCIGVLHKILSEVVVPKSIETVKRKEPIF